MTGRTQTHQRSQSILHAIVEAYIETGEPVASRTIARSGGGQLSPATIRNVMADLCDDGYLAQPHTSAGRIPTVKAIRDYVEHLPPRRFPANDLQRLRSELRRTDSVEARLECTSHLLTEMTRKVGIAAAIPSDGQTLSKVELVLLSGQRVLMIVETRDGIVRNRVVSIEAEVTQDDLNVIRNFLNQTYAGWTLGAVRKHLHASLAQERALYDHLLQKVQVFYEKGLLDMGLTPEVHFEGTSNLVSGDVPISQEQLRGIFRTLEEKKRLLDLLDRFLEQSSSEVVIQVGLGELHPSLQDLSLIGLNIMLPSGMATRVAVLGPIRMNYGQVMSTVYHVGEAIQSISGELANS
jgi:heat-inducible transcriptional repressor